MRFVTVLALLAVGASIPASAQPISSSSTPAAVAQPVDQALAAAVVTDLARKLEDNFVSPEVGRAYAGRLRAQLNAGAYSGFADGQAFADKVTADLQAVNKDGHLRLFAPKLPGTKSKFRTEPSSDGAIGKSGWIADGVAYIELTMFPSDEKTLGSLRAFLESHGSAGSVIIDIRGHHGGDIGEIDLLASYLYPEPTVLAQMDTRQAVEDAGLGVFTDGPALRRIDGPEGVVRREHFVNPGEATGLRSAKLFLLVSRRTVSAGEHLAMVVKRTGRATLIGETTRGAGNFGNQYKLPGGYSAFIPVGRSFDPDTGEGWEGVGVAPNVPIAAEKALDEALRLVGVAATGEAALAALR